MPCSDSRQISRSNDEAGLKLMVAPAEEEDRPREVDQCRNILDDAGRAAELSRIEAGIPKMGHATCSFGEMMPPLRERGAQ